jgi:signal transduction histidine kinase
VSEQGRESVTETALRVALVLAGLGYAIALFIARPIGGSPVALGQAGFQESYPDVVIGVLLTSAGMALTLVGGSRGAGLVAAGVGVAWLAIVPAGSVLGTDLLRGPGQASAMLLGPSLLGLVVALAASGQRSRRTIWSSAMLVVLAVLVAALRLAAYDPFADPTCVNCGHGGRPLLVATVDQRMLLDRAAAALTIASAGGQLWFGIGWLRGSGRVRGGKLAAVVGSIVVGLALAAGAVVQSARATQLPVSVGGQQFFGVIELAKTLGGGLLVIGLVLLVVDVVGVRVRMRQLAHDIASATELGRLDLRLASTLNDPSVVVGYWFESEGRYVSASGTPLASPSADGEHNQVTIERDRQRIAAIWHRRGIEPVAIRNELTSSLLVALDNERLQAVGMANLSALQTSRARLVALHEEQRRQVERDLHDGLQQRLLAIVFDLRLARVAAERIGENRRSPWLARAEALSLSMVEEVRRLARGIYPAILSQAGLAAALSSLADEAPIPIAVSVEQGLRLPQPLEASVYQIIADALADAVRGGAAELSVVIERIGAIVAVGVDHDGVTASVPVRLVDRIAAAGGSLTVEASADRSGRRLRIALPCV